MSSDLKEVADELVGLESNRIWSTIKNLTLQPGLIIRRYCEGDKSLLISPAAYYFTIMALSYALYSATGYNDAIDKFADNQFNEVKAATKSEEGLKQFAKVQGFNKKFNELFRNDTTRNLIFLPFLLLLRWLFFRKYVKGFKANTWYSLLTMGHMALMGTPLMVLIWYLTGTFDFVGLVSLMILVFYDVWAAKQFYAIELGAAIARSFFYYATVGLISGVVALVWLLILLS